MNPVIEAIHKRRSVSARSILAYEYEYIKLYAHRFIPVSL